MVLIEPLQDLDGFLLDLDGVVYLKYRPIPAALRFIREARGSGRRVIFLTNNSSRTRQQYSTMLTSMGIECAPQDVVTSAYATATLLAARRPRARVFCVGEDGLVRELQAQGLKVVDDPPVDFVVAGIDFHFTYEKLAKASTMIMKGARFVSTNRDATFPTEEGPRPGAGSIVSAIQTASGRRPLNVGKPNRRMFEAARRILGLDASRIGVVGDRMETDILGGIRAGMKTILVLTGVTDPETLRSSKIRPDLVLNTLDEAIE